MFAAQLTRSFAISPAVSGLSTWDLDVDGPLTLTTAGSWSLTFSSAVILQAELWGGGGTGAQSNAIPVSGNASTFSSLTAGGGIGGRTFDLLGEGGTASGGDINTTGGQGTQEKGGDGANGGVGGADSVNGTAPGGGGGGTNDNGGRGGGGGAYCKANAISCSGGLTLVVAAASAANGAAGTGAIGKAVLT